VKPVFETFHEDLAGSEVIAFSAGHLEAGFDVRDDLITMMWQHARRFASRRLHRPVASREHPVK